MKQKIWPGNSNENPGTFISFVEIESICFLFCCKKNVPNKGYKAYPGISIYE